MENIEYTEATTINKRRMSFVIVHTISDKLFIGYCQHILAIFMEADGEYHALTILANYIVCPEWDNMIAMQSDLKSHGEDIVQTQTE